MATKSKSNYSKDALEAVARRLSGRDDLKEPSFEIKSGCMATIVDRRDKYKKEGLLGGEKFKFFSAWAGKSGKLIFRLKPTRPAGYKFVEFNHDDLEKYFPKLTGMIENVLETDIKTYLDNYSSVYEEKEAAIELAEKQKQYGANWGMF